MIDSADRRRIEETGIELGQLMEEEKLQHVPVRSEGSEGSNEGEGSGGG